MVHGAFLVSASCSNGEVEDVTLYSEQGCTCVLENPWKGSKCEVVHGDGTCRQFEGDRLTFETVKGKNLIVRKKD